MIGHLKSDGRLGRNFLKGRDGDKINAILAGAGYNYRLVLAFKWVNTTLGNVKNSLRGTPSVPSTHRDTWPSSNTASIAATAWTR